MVSQKYINNYEKRNALQKIAFLFFASSYHGTSNRRKYVVKLNCLRLEIFDKCSIYADDKHLYFKIYLNYNKKISIFIRIDHVGFYIMVTVR